MGSAKACAPDLHLEMTLLLPKWVTAQKQITTFQLPFTLHTNLDSRNPVHVLT